MTAPLPYFIELPGRIPDGMLDPYAAEFVIARRLNTTTMSGLIRDASHLHGIVIHLTGLGLVPSRIQPSGRHNTDTPTAPPPALVE